HLGGEHQRAGWAHGDTVSVHIQHTGVAHLVCNSHLIAVRPVACFAIHEFIPSSLGVLDAASRARHTCCASVPSLCRSALSFDDALATLQWHSSCQAQASSGKELRELFSRALTSPMHYRKWARKPSASVEG